jgi:murein DD-endopeptidase MepM/ murein hydrolase activator NlpD
MKNPPRLPLKALLLLCILLLFCGAAPVSCLAGSRTAAAEAAAPVVEADPASETVSVETAAPAAEIPGAGTAAAEAAARAALLNASPKPGEPFVVALALPPELKPDPAAPVRALLLDSAGRRTARASFFSAGEDGPGGYLILAALLAVPSTMRSGQAAVRIEGPPLLVLEDLPLTIEKREFLSETIDLDNRNTAIRTEPDPQKTGEAEQLQAILAHTGTQVYVEGAFTPPVTSTRRTSFYGDRRVYRYTDGSTGTSIHAGVDYGVPAGTNVGACAAGRVVLAQSRIVTGNSVVIEHFPGVYSLYYHLDSIAVRENDMVMAGTILGESGATGLATGPHLHWEIRVAGENADPDALTARPLLDKNEIFTKLFQ